MTFATLGIVVHWLLVAGIGVRVIMKRPEPGVALAWLFVVSLVPYFGALAYLLIGEKRVDARRGLRVRVLQDDYRRRFGDGNDGPTPVLDDPARGLDAIGRTFAGSAAVGGSSLALHADAAGILRAIAGDIDAATTSVVMEFYICGDGGAADAVFEALIRAAARGVPCRLLADAVGARPWWKGPTPQRLKAAGVAVLPALPSGALHTVFARADLRLHRKIVAVDGRIAWTGSMNLVDPAFFKTGEGFGEWVDAMVRVEGPAVSRLSAVVNGDWSVESGERVGTLVPGSRVAEHGGSAVQVIPTGPGEGSDALLQMLLALLADARRELVMTTPYLIPDTALLRALRGAAGRGVRVTLVVPERVDSVLARHASRSYYDDLLDVGVTIRLYRRGLLHTKSITADGSRAMFGTANLDMRSLWLNYEVALFVYDPAFTAALRTLQDSYIADSDEVAPAAWAARPFATRFVQDAARLMSPLL